MMPAINKITTQQKQNTNKKNIYGKKLDLNLKAQCNKPKITKQKTLKSQIHLYLTTNVHNGTTYPVDE